MSVKALIFDFDGTICDTGEGIMKSARFALDAFGIDAPEWEELGYFIGPPLLVTFQERFGKSPQEADELVKKFRERYRTTGVFESRLYDGIKEMLVSLKNDGFKVGIASSKPQEFIEKLLKHFGISELFDSVCGVSFKADCESKQSIISRCIGELGCERSECLMVGDRKYDIEGAKENSLVSVGVIYDRS